MFQISVICVAAAATTAKTGCAGRRYSWQHCRSKWSVETAIGGSYQRTHTFRAEPSTTTAMASAATPSAADCDTAEHSAEAAGVGTPTTR